MILPKSPSLNNFANKHKNKHVSFSCHSEVTDFRFNDTSFHKPPQLALVRTCQDYIYKNTSDVFDDGKEEKDNKKNFSKKVRKALKYTLLGAAALMLSSSFLYRELFFHPNKTIKSFSEYLKKAIDSGKVQKVKFNVTRHSQLNGIYKKAKDGLPTIVYCNPRSNNLTTCQHIMEGVMKNDKLKDYGVLMVDYRGTGLNLGRVNEAKATQDIEAAIKFLNEKNNVNTNNIILWGRSLGSSIAINVASKIQGFKKVIIESSFDKPIDIAKKKMAKWGIKLKKLPFFKKALNTGKKVKDIKAPTMIFHSTKDDVVPIGTIKKLEEKIHRSGQCKNIKFTFDDFGKHTGFSQKMQDAIHKFIATN